MPSVLMFAQAREAAGVSRVNSEGATVADVVQDLRARFGEEFSEVIATSTIWCNGERAQPGDSVHSGDEVAILPPVSGG